MQMSMFEFASPLDGTVGREFFSELPKVPGVYRMYGDRNELLYVGKAKDLRVRLMSYRRVKLGKSSSKSLRLVHSVSKIEIERCESEEHALLMENELLRTHKPPFNVVNTRPEKYFYFVVNVHGKLSGEEKIRASIEMALTSQVEGAVYGAYKGLSLCHRTFLALRRVLWTLNQEPPADYLNAEPFRYPLELFRKQKLVPVEFEITRSDLNLLAGLLHGHTGGPVEMEPELLLRAALHFSRFPADPFHRKWFQEDLETLSRFFRVGPLRNRRLKAHSTEDSPVIAQHLVDDLVVRQRFKTA